MVCVAKESTLKALQKKGMCSENKGKLVRSIQLMKLLGYSTKDTSGHLYLPEEDVRRTA